MSETADNGLISEICGNIREDGLIRTLAAGPRYGYSNYLRSYLLTGTDTVELNGVESPYRISIFDRIVPGFSRPKDNPRYESAEVAALRSYCRERDTIVIVGAGRGVTPTIAARVAGEEGEVIAYEASVERLERARATIDYNGVAGQVTLEHAIVAKAESVKGSIGTAAVIAPEDLPHCEYLELDCEGAEEQILENMTITPRVISVETHETKGASHANVVAELANRGYEIVEETDKTDTHEGIRHLVALREG